MTAVSPGVLTGEGHVSLQINSGLLWLFNSKSTLCLLRQVLRGVGFSLLSARMLFFLKKRAIYLFFKKGLWKPNDLPAVALQTETSTVGTPLSQNSFPPSSPGLPVQVSRCIRLSEMISPRGYFS